MGPDVSAPAIVLSNLTVAYDRHPGVHHVSGTFETGSMTAIVGPNGAGKSTLLKAIVGLKAPAQGSVRLGGVKSADVAYLPQAAEIDRSFPISVIETVLLGFWNQLGWFGAVSRAQKLRAQEALGAVGLDGFGGRPVGSLSAGQFQRVLFARVMVQDAAIVMLDEPFNAIDARTTRDLLDLVCRWHQGEQRTIIAVLHDHDQVRRHFPKTLLIARETIAWGRTEEVLTPGNLLRARRMAESWDEDAPICEAEPERAGLAP